MMENEEKEKVIKSFRKKAILGIVTSSIITFGLGLVVGFGVKKENTSEYSKEFQAFLNTYKYFKDNYYIEEDERTLIDGLYYGLTSSTDDAYTFYVSSKNNESQNLQTSGVGVGVERVNYYGNCLITHVMKNSPASKARFIDSSNRETGEKGLQDGDIILKVKEANIDEDYFVLKDNPTSTWSSRISGEANTEVEFVIKRGEETKRCIVKRGTFDTDKVRLVSKNYSPDYKEAVVKITSFLGNDSFNETTPAREMIDLLNSNLLNGTDHIDNLVLDLRGNGGGYVNNCSELLSLFVGKKSSYGYSYYPRTGKYESISLGGNIYSYNGWKNFNDKIGQYTLIINNNSASAAESFVLNMRDFDETKNKVKIVGELSYGKGISQSFIFPFASTSGDSISSIRYTNAKVVSCKKNSIHKRGIVPDIMVDSEYRSIQDDNEYEYYRKEVTSISESKDKAIVVSRINALLSESFTDVSAALKAFKKAYGLTENDIYDEECATLLNDKFYDYYIKYHPSNIYTTYVEGNDDIDLFSPAQRKHVKKQIERIMGSSYSSFYEACKAFQNANGIISPYAYSLETSYLLQGKLYDIEVNYENSVVEVAKLSYGA